MEMERCIDNCTNCHRICLDTAARHFRGEGEMAETHVRLLLDCAEICQTSANFMLRGSDLHARTCGVCAEICERCAEACEQLGEDPPMQNCAAACRRCAESCRRMTMMMAA